MIATLADLEGKYYGTNIILNEGSSRRTISVWFGHGFGCDEPSDRELDPYTRQQWIDNIDVPYGWDGEDVPIRFADYVDWGHYESVETLAVAQLIVDALNGATP